MVRMEPSGEMVPARLAESWTLVPIAALASPAVAILAIRLHRAREDAAAAPPPIALELQAREIPERRETESAQTEGLINESNARTSVASVPAPVPARLMPSREERALPANHHALRSERKTEAST
jgi:hypothetical protein